MIDIVNASLQSIKVQISLKIPFPKSLVWTHNDLNNYRPISNLPFLSKILERAVAAQLPHHYMFNRMKPSSRVTETTTAESVSFQKSPKPLCVSWWPFIWDTGSESSESLAYLCNLLSPYVGGQGPRHAYSLFLETFFHFIWKKI